MLKLVLGVAILALFFSLSFINLDFSSFLTVALSIVEMGFTKIIPLLHAAFPFEELAKNIWLNLIFGVVLFVLLVRLIIGIAGQIRVEWQKNEAAHKKLVRKAERQKRERERQIKKGIFHRDEKTGKWGLLK